MVKTNNNNLNLVTESLSHIEDEIARIEDVLARRLVKLENIIDAKLNHIYMTLSSIEEKLDER